MFLLFFRTKKSAIVDSLSFVGYRQYSPDVDTLLITLDMIHLVFVVLKITSSSSKVSRNEFTPSSEQLPSAYS